MNRNSSLKTYTPLRAKKPWNPKRKPLATRTGLTTHTTLKTKKRIRKVGKNGKANHESRQEIARISEAKGLKRCEIGLEGCMKTWPLAPAHRHKRAWYKGDAALLAHPDQWVCACQVCHDQIEVDAALTEEIFLKLRGPEILESRLAEVY